MTTLLAPSTLTEKMLGAYRRDGYVVISGLFAPDEIAILRGAAEHDLPGAQILTKQDQDGNKVSLKMWGHAGDDIYGMFSRNERVVNAAERVIGDEIYLYSAKMILKDAREGGAWEWHQDYGYWYQNGVLFPLLTSAFIAVDRATKENGCLQVVRGSHHLGRIEHTLKGEQAGADQERVDRILERLDVVHVEMEPGDTLFFHANLLHRSDQNTSDKPRWSMICCYNAARNNPYMESHHPRYTPLVKVPDEAILAAGLKRFTDSEASAGWLDPKSDSSAVQLEKHA